MSTASFSSFDRNRFESRRRRWLLILVLGASEVCKSFSNLDFITVVFLIIDIFILDSLLICFFRVKNRIYDSFIWKEVMFKVTMTLNLIELERVSNYGMLNITFWRTSLSSNLSRRIQINNAGSYIRLALIYHIISFLSLGAAGVVVGQPFDTVKVSQTPDNYNWFSFSLKEPNKPKSGYGIFLVIKIDTGSDHGWVQKVQKNISSFVYFQHKHFLLL